jgi:hypothetical protein
MKEPMKCTSVRIACEEIKDPLPSARSRALGKVSYFFIFQRVCVNC